ncbi:MAG: hypothetical protein MUO76_21980 [Anaerolineaceae bacterium]|nr:hypothetical protein [Anaerolineaceae bacterium]
MAIVTIGITGHRHLAELEKIMAGVECAVKQIIKAFPNSNFRVLSSLAEGADQILAKRLLLISLSTLWVPLPLSKEEYFKDFNTSQSKAEFTDLLGKAERVICMPEMNKREYAYLAAGKYVVDNCDLLMAVWDGAPAHGKGGTAEIVALAREHHLPLAYIHAGNRVPGTSVSTSLCHEQGMVTFENFPLINRKPI